VDAARERGLDHGPSLRRLDAPVVGPVGQRDEVAREAVAADVGRLPDPPLLDLLTDGFVERPAVLGTAAVVLAVRADEEERMPDRCARVLEVEPDQVVVPVELEAAELAVVVRGPREEGEQPVLAAPLATADEENPCMREPTTLGSEERLQLRTQRRAIDRVVRPEPAVLEQDPRVDTARRRTERLRVSQRRLGTERFTRPGRGRSPARL